MLILGALLLVPPVGPVPDAGAVARRAPSQCQAVQVFSLRQPGRRDVFSASRSLDLHLKARLGNDLEGAHTVEFRVHTPRGFLYQTLSVPYTLEPKPRPRTRKRKDGGTTGPEALGEVPVLNEAEVDSSGRPTLEASLPVAGTAITTNSLYGRWTVRPYLDGQPCGPAKPFTLEP